jgi:hypothetical protein
MDEYSADFVCEGWNDLAEHDGGGPVFLPVRLTRKLELA